MRRLFSLTFTGMLAMALLSGCGKRNEYPDQPVISLKDAHIKPGQNFQLDTLFITTDFTDGNGDLGLGNEELDVQPFQKYLQKDGQPSQYDSTRINRRHFNYFPVVYIEKSAGIYDTIPPTYNTLLNGQLALNRWGYFSSFQPTADMNQGASIRGSITFQVPDIFIGARAPGTDQLWLVPGKRWYVKIFIMDRAGNVSNVEQSNPVIYQP